MKDEFLHFEKQKDSKIEFLKKQPYSYEKDIRDVDFDLAMDHSKEMQEMFDQLQKMNEYAAFYDLRARGVISNVVLVINPDHKGIIEQTLYSAGIKRIPIIYSDCVKPDRAYGITDRYMVEKIKKNLCWEEGDKE